MLERNKRIKQRPERFQDCKEKFDLVVTCEERVYDQVLEGQSVSEPICKLYWYYNFAPSLKFPAWSIV